MLRPTVLLLALALLASGARADDATATGPGPQIKRLAEGAEQDRIRAAVLLGTPGADPKAILALGEAVASGPGVVRVAAVRALARTAQPQAVAALVEALAGGDAVVADEARLALRELAGPRTASELVAAFDAHPAARAPLVPALLACAEPNAQGRVGDALADADAQVRATADRSLRLAPRDSQLTALTHCLTRVPEPDRLPCVLLAGELRDRRLVAALAPLATDPYGTAAVRDAARQGLVAMKDELDAPLLAETARIARTGEQRAGALALLSVVHDERAFVALTRGLDDPDDSVRARAAFCLGGFGDARAVKALARAVNDERNARIRRVLQGALDRLVRQG